MKIYCQFQVMSTGYVPNSEPPKFSKEYEELQDMLGSDGVYILDARNSLENQIVDCIDKASRLLKKPQAFKIVRAERFTDKGVILHEQLLTDI